MISIFITLLCLGDHVVRASNTNIFRLKTFSSVDRISVYDELDETKNDDDVSFSPLDGEKGNGIVSVGDTKRTKYVHVCDRYTVCFYEQWRVE